MTAKAKWIEGIDASTPIVEAARRVLRARLDRVTRLVQSFDGRAEADYAHQVRVASRRASAALEAFEACVEPAEWARARKRLKKIRRVAGAARECDVHGGLLAALAERASEGQRAVIEHLRARIEREREGAVAALGRGAEDEAAKGGRRTRRRILRGLSDPAGRAGPTRLADEAARVVGGLVERARGAAEADLDDADNLHALRLRSKNLRYALEVFASCFGPELRERVYPRLVEFQEMLGGVNDMHQIVRRLERELQAPQAGPCAPGLREGIAALKQRYEAVRDQRSRDAIDRIRAPGGLDFLSSLRAMVAGRESVGAGAGPGAEGRAVIPGAPAVHGTPNGSGTLAPAPADGPRRLAAIDVGTNSIRLLVAEAHPDGSYRVLDDEKEITRLGRGLGECGVMSAESMERTIIAVDRMKRIAMGYGVHGLRAVGTSACREAGNRDVFLVALRERTGIALEVISAHEEARLAFLSAAHSFDLRGLSAAVVDIGGGSTEIVLSAGGVTQQIHSLPLGAVRLTEQFGGPEESSGARFKKMRRHIRRMLEETVGEPALAPQLVIGTGGTFTALASVLIHREQGGVGPSLWDRGVPGHEAHRSDVRHVLDRLRRMPVRERARVPGLPEERADIIVAGLAIVERVLRHLGANVVRVHERGIRDGLVIQMADEIFPPAAGVRGGRSGDRAMGAVRRFAIGCRYEQEHSEHVTRLALSLYDQMAEHEEVPDADRRQERRLLEAAGVLHDCGYLVNYSRHHRHSYHMIVHSDIAGFTRREIEVIANVARYHRQAEPRKRHPEFAALSRPDRALVRRLAGVLRVADGLDRTHTQNVRSVKVLFEGPAVRLLVTAPEDPATDLWGASRKSGLFEGVYGLEPRFSWIKADVPADPGDSVVASRAVPLASIPVPAAPALERVAARV